MRKSFVLAKAWFKFLQCTITSLLFSAASTPLYAESVSDPTFGASEIFSVAHGDWNNDEFSDAVMVIHKDAQQFDVLFFLSNENGRLKLHDYVPDMVWGSSVMFGQEPWVEALENGSISLGSQNFSIGRNRWEQKLTIAFRGLQFVVAGFSYSHYDTLDPDANGSCDLNLLTGKGIVDGDDVRFQKASYGVNEIGKNLDQFYDLCLKNHR